MKQLYLCVLLACWCTLSSLAQGPTENLTALKTPPGSKKQPFPAPDPGVPPKKPQLWKKEHDEVNGHIDRTLLKTMKKTTQAIVDLLRDSCLSEGSFIPGWHGEFFSEKRSSSPRMKFGLECHFQENSAQIKVTANDFTILFRDTLYVNRKVFQTLKGTKAVKNGFPYFEYLAAAGEGPADERPVHTKLWLITTAPDKLPYVPVTRKEYLEEASQEVKDEKD